MFRVAEAHEETTMVRSRLLTLGKVGALALVIMLAVVACGPAQAPSAQKTATPGPSSTIVVRTPTATLTPSEPACQITQLAGQFRAGSPATGNVTGGILLRNSSATACGVQGTVDFYGVNAQGQRVPGSGMYQPQTLALVVLPPNTPVLPPSVAVTPGAYLVMSLTGAYRDDPTAPNGLCSATNEITPARLVLSVGSISVSVTNYDAAGGHFPSMMGCHGKIIGGDAFLSY